MAGQERAADHCGAKRLTLLIDDRETDVGHRCGRIRLRRVGAELDRTEEKGR